MKTKKRIHSNPSTVIGKRSKRRVLLGLVALLALASTSFSVHALWAGPAATQRWLAQQQGFGYYNDPYAFMYYRQRPMISTGPAIINGQIPASPLQMNNQFNRGYYPLGQHPYGMFYSQPQVIANAPYLNGGFYMGGGGAMTMIPTGAVPGGIGANSPIGMNLLYQHWGQSRQESQARGALGFR